MHSPIRRYAAAFAISTALLVAGCSSGGDQSAADAADTPDEVFLQPVAAQGPDPFTDSTATTADAPPVTRTPQPSPTGSPTGQGVRSFSGETPGLYGGTQSIASCDVEQQVRYLTSDQAKARAFVEVVGIKQSDIAGWLRGLTPVQVRADTRVTNHGYRDGQPTSFQSVLQTGTAVLVDDRGMPRVRCACGNPLTPPAALKGGASHQGKPWGGYHPTRTVVITPAPKVIINIIIVNITNNTWIERPIGDDGSNDKVVPPPPSPDPSLDPSASPSQSPSQSPSPDDSGSVSPDESGSVSPDEDESDSPSPDESDDSDEADSPSPGDSPTDCPTVLPTTPTPDVPGGPTPSPSPLPSGCPTPPPGEDTPREPEPQLPPDQPTVPDDTDDVTDGGVFNT
ncbi:DUF6777 domain-containing protein [Streptomyces sp. E11-3]|uniref:DUF6777 domain-containing protein n=1 Tax=Streptomyces sp. E11-3 TaxID=3110112 RepID=UPI00398010FC